MIGCGQLGVNQRGGEWGAAELCHLSQRLFLLLAGRSPDTSITSGEGRVAYSPRPSKSSGEYFPGMHGSILRNSLGDTFTYTSGNILVPLINYHPESWFIPYSGSERGWPYSREEGVLGWNIDMI